VNVRVPVNLGGGRLKNPRFDALSQTEHVDRANDARLGRLDWIELVVNRRSRTGEVENLVYLYVEGKRYVVAHELEPRIAEQMGDVVARA
jgi:hypothetical protein